MTRSSRINKHLTALSMVATTAVTVVSAIFLDLRTDSGFTASATVLAILSGTWIVLLLSLPFSRLLGLAQSFQWRKPIAPLELPAPPPLFVGRDQEVARIERLLRAGGGGNVVVIHGGPGIGKTSLALHIAQRLAAEYRDGQLYASFATVGKRDPKRVVARVLEDFLRAIYRRGASIPKELAHKQAAFRSATKSRRILTILDDAPYADLSQFIPVSQSCDTIITARVAPAFPGITLAVELLPLSEEDAVDLLRHIVGTRIDQKPETARNLASSCAYHPLALQMAGAALVSRPASDLSWILENARAGGSDVQKAQADPDSVNEWALDLVYSLLPHDEREALLRLGLLQLAFEPKVLSKVLHADEKDAWHIADRLVAAQLVERSSNDSVGQVVYRTVEHVKEYAESKAKRELSSTVQAEVRNLSKLTPRGAARETVELRARVYRNLDQGRLTEAMHVAHEALEISRRSGSKKSEALTLAALAELKAELGGTDDVVELANKAWEHPSRAVRARVARIMGHVQRRVRRLDLANASLRRALRLADSDRSERVRVLIERALVARLEGNLKAGLSYVDKAEAHLSGRSRESDLQQMPRLLVARGSILTEQGRWDEALATLGRAAEIASAEQQKQRLWQAWIDYRRAKVYLRQQDFDAARAAAFRSIELFTQLRHRYGAGHGRLLLSNVYIETEMLELSVQACEEALETFSSCGDWWMERLATVRLARLNVRLGNEEEYVDLLHKARTLTTASDGLSARLWIELACKWADAKHLWAGSSTRDKQLSAARDR